MHRNNHILSNNLKKNPSSTVKIKKFHVFRLTNRSSFGKFVGFSVPSDCGNYLSREIFSTEENYKITQQRKITFCTQANVNELSSIFARGDEVSNFSIFRAWMRHCHPGVFEKMPKEKDLLHYFIIANREKSRLCIDFS